MQKRSQPRTFAAHMRGMRAHIYDNGQNCPKTKENFHGRSYNFSSRHVRLRPLLSSKLDAGDRAARHHGPARRNRPPRPRRPNRAARPYGRTGGDRGDGAARRARHPRCNGPDRPPRCNRSDGAAGRARYSRRNGSDRAAGYPRHNGSHGRTGPYRPTGRTRHPRRDRGDRPHRAPRRNGADGGECAVGVDDGIFHPVAAGGGQCRRRI